MKKNCGHTVPCGCGDQSLNTPPPCNTTGSCVGEECSELFCEECLLHCGETMVIPQDDPIPDIVIPQGMRLSDFMQLILVRMLNSNCVGTAVLGLAMLEKTTNSIRIKWTGEANRTYTIFWREGSNTYSANVNGIDGINTYQIINLLPDTEYDINIVTYGTTCSSVTLRIKTLPTP